MSWKINDQNEQEVTWQEEEHTIKVSRSGGGLVIQVVLNNEDGSEVLMYKKSIGSRQLGLFLSL